MIDKRNKINNLINPSMDQYQEDSDTDLMAYSKALGFEYVEPKPLSIHIMEHDRLQDIMVLDSNNKTVLEYYEELMADDEHDIMEEMILARPFFDNKIVRLSNNSVFGSTDNVYHIMRALRHEKSIFYVEDFTYSEDEIKHLTQYTGKLPSECVYHINNSLQRLGI